MLTLCPSVLPPLTGLGDQAGAEQPRHLPGRQDESYAAQWISTQEEAAGAEEWSELQERLGRRLCGRPLWPDPVQRVGRRDVLIDPAGFPENLPSVNVHIT